MPPALNTTEGAGKPPKPSFWPKDTPLPSPHINNKFTIPSRREQGKLLLVLALYGCSRGPSKALPKFLVWPLINFY